LDAGPALHLKGRPLKNKGRPFKIRPNPGLCFGQPFFSNRLVISGLSNDKDGLLLTNIEKKLSF
jgi:hypothetical protein